MTDQQTEPRRRWRNRRVPRRMAWLFGVGVVALNGVAVFVLESQHAMMVLVASMPLLAGVWMKTEKS